MCDSSTAGDGGGAAAAVMTLLLGGCACHSSQCVIALLAGNGAAMALLTGNVRLSQLAVMLVE